MPNYRTTRAGVILAVRDVPRLAEFYERTLGFEVVQTFDDPPYAILAASGMRLSLTADGARGEDLPEVTFRAAADGDRPASCLVLEVDDCDAARADLTARGVTLRSETFRPPWGGARFFCEDPEGTLIEIEELA